MKTSAGMRPIIIYYDFIIKNIAIAHILRACLIIMSIRNTKNIIINKSGRPT